MTQRSPIMVLVYSILTCGIYLLYWFIKTKDEMNAKYNTGIPTGWYLLIPLVGGIIWGWKYWQGVEKITGFSGVGGFLLCAFNFMWLAVFITQGKFNELSASGGMARAA